MTINVAGTVYWKVTYPGDANNNAAVSSCEPFFGCQTVTVDDPAITAQATPMKVGEQNRQRIALRRDQNGGWNRGLHGLLRQCMHNRVDREQ